MDQCMDLVNKKAQPVTEGLFLRGPDGTQSRHRLSISYVILPNTGTIRPSHAPFNIDQFLDLP